MSLSKIVQMSGYLLLGLAGLVLFGLGAYGSVRLRLLRFERSFTAKQRLRLTGLGLLFMALAFTSIAALMGEA
ncbi:MAG: hypothetical protein P8129_04410 [Anaerolineae bacterium]|jgi:hypothetical protein